MICYFKNVRCLCTWGILFQISHYSKSVLFWLMIILEFLCYFYPFIIANMCWLSFTGNELFLIIGSIKHSKSQCGKMETRICYFCYVNIQLKCHKLHNLTCIFKISCYGNFVMTNVCLIQARNYNSPWEPYLWKF